jgi:hypothetical protein
MPVEKNESDLTEDLARPSRKSWFKVRSRKGHALSYTAAAFSVGIILFGLGILTGMSISDLHLWSAVANR